MSYILEALKKAQAERQLGATPGLDTPPLVPAAAAAAPSNARWFALGSAILLLAAAVGYAGLERKTGAVEEKPVQPVVAAAPAQVPAAAPAARPLPAAGVVSNTAPALPVPEPAKPAPERREPVPAMSKPATVPAPAPAPMAAAADPDEALPLLTQLPPEIQHAVPAVSFGGYMYSSNPADRLLIIDKVLRKEGDSVAPGLILERLLPKCAVLNFKGTRYRVPY